MKKSVVVGLILLGALAMYVVGVFLLATTPHANAIPTPGYAVVGGVLAMFATLGVFLSGFIIAASDET